MEVVTYGVRAHKHRLLNSGFFLAEFGETDELLKAAKSANYAPIFELYPHRVSNSTGGEFAELHCQVSGVAKKRWPRQQSVILSRTGETSRAAEIILGTVKSAIARHTPFLTEKNLGICLREATFIKDQDITEDFLKSLSRYHQQEGFEFPPDYVYLLALRQHYKKLGV